MPDFKPGVHVTTDNLAKVMKQIAKLSGQEVLVGIPDSAPERHDSPVTNAQLLYIHEYGAPEANIPARPSVIPGIEDAKDAITAQMEKGSRALMGGNTDAAEKALHAAGLIAVSSIKDKITEGDFAPLAESTIAARKRKGNDSTKPLVVTAQMRNAITYVIAGGSEAPEANGNSNSDNGSGAAEDIENLAEGVAGEAEGGIAGLAEGAEALLVF